MINFIFALLFLFNCMSLEVKGISKQILPNIKYSTEILPSIDIEISKNKNINISDLFSVKYNTFNSENYIKILTVPEDFIFTNYLNEKTEIKPGIYLSQNDKLILKQYKKKTKASLEFEYLTKVENISTSIEKYQNNSQIPRFLSSIEGTKGKITLEINSCDNGFYEIEFSNNICTNIKPDGYYLDELSNMYKLIQNCYPLCSNCTEDSTDGSKMNCIDCIDGYYLDPLTTNCILKKEEDESAALKKESSPYKIVFIILIIFSIIAGLYFSLWGWLNDLIKKKKVPNQTILELQNNNNENL